MERIHAKSISKKEYTRNFKIKQTNVPYIHGRPTWTPINLVQEAIEANLVAMHDAQEGKYGKLFLVHNTASLAGGTAVTPSADQGTQPEISSPKLKILEQRYIFLLTNMIIYDKIILLKF